MAAVSEGTALLFHGAVGEQERAQILAVDGVEGLEPLGEGIWMAWTVGGRVFTPSRGPLGGQHGSPRCRTQLAIVSGGHPQVAELGRWLAAGPPSALDWLFWPVVDAVRDLGGSARPREVVDLVLEKAGVGDDERAERNKSGSLPVSNQIHWARNYLEGAGLLDGSERGVWALTPAGWALDLSTQDHVATHELFKKVRDAMKEGGRGRRQG